jgi:hypothetical protein
VVPGRTQRNHIQIEALCHPREQLAGLSGHAEARCVLTRQGGAVLGEPGERVAEVEPVDEQHRASFWCQLQRTPLQHALHQQVCLIAGVAGQLQPLAARCAVQRDLEVAVAEPLDRAEHAEPVQRQLDALGRVEAQHLLDGGSARHPEHLEQVRLGQPWLLAEFFVAELRGEPRKPGVQRVDPGDG